MKLEQLRYLWKEAFYKTSSETGENGLHELWVNNCEYIQRGYLWVNNCEYIQRGYYLFSTRYGFQAWAHETLLNLQWLVLKINGADFLHCQFADST